MLSSDHLLHHDHPCHDACENVNCLADVLARLSSVNLLASSRSTRARCQGRRRWSPTSRWWRSPGLPCWQPWPRSRGWFCWFLNRSNSGPANRPKNSRLRNHRGQAAELHPQRWPGPPQHFISIPIFFHLSTSTSTTWLSGERGVPHNGCLRVPGYSRTTPAAEVCIIKKTCNIHPLFILTTSTIILSTHRHRPTHLRLPGQASPPPAGGQQEGLHLAPPPHPAANGDHCGLCH